MRQRLGILTGAPAKPAAPPGPVSPRSPCEGKMFSQTQKTHHGCAFWSGGTYRGTTGSRGSRHSNGARLTLPAEQQAQLLNTLCHRGVVRSLVMASPTYPLTLRSRGSRQSNSTSQTTGSVLARSSFASLDTSLSLKGATCLGWRGGVCTAIGYSTVADTKWDRR